MEQEENTNKKGISDEAKAFSAAVRQKYVNFVQERGFKAISDKTGCTTQVLRNTVVDGRNPSLDTLCQILLGYPEELDINYLFYGKKNELVETPLNHTSEFEEQVEKLKKKLAELQEKIGEKDDLINSLKQDKIHLQNDKQYLWDMIKKPTPIE